MSTNARVKLHIHEAKLCIYLAWFCYRHKLTGLINGPQELKKAWESAPAWVFGPCRPCIFRFSSVWIRDRVWFGRVRFRLFPKSLDYKYVPYDIRKRERHHVLQQHLGATPPLILGFHPSKLHAALIVFLWSGQHCSCLYLGITRTEAFLWRVVLVILMFVAWFLVDSLCFIAYHLQISCCFCTAMFQSYANSCCIKLVARRQHPASFPSSRSNLLRFVLMLKNWRNIC